MKYKVTLAKAEVKRKEKETKKGKEKGNPKKYNIMPVSVIVKMCMEDMRKWKGEVANLKLKFHLRRIKGMTVCT